MADALTANFGWVKPNVNDPAGQDLWGGKINTDLDSIDAQMLVAQSPAGGFLNKLRNGTFDVWQRGTSAISVANGATGYVADGWILAPTGAAMTGQQGAGRGPTLNALQINGAASVTAAAVQHRIESAVAAALGVVSVTFQAQIYNGFGSAITPTLTVSHPTTVDTAPYGTTDLAAVNLQSCANAAWTRVAYTFTAPQASANLGLQVAIGFGALTTGSVRVAEADFRATPGLPVGLCANPPPPELRPIHEEMMFCQRYFCAVSGYAGVCMQGNITSGASAFTVYRFPVRMRVAPSPSAVVLTNVASSNFPATPGTPSNLTQDNFAEARTASATGSGYFGSSFTASAEL